MKSTWKILKGYNLNLVKRQCSPKKQDMNFAYKIVFEMMELFPFL